MPNKNKVKVVKTSKKRDKTYNKASFSLDINLKIKKQIKEEKEENFS